MTFRHAITRLPGDDFADGLTRVDLGRADVALALAQHAAYRDALRACGLDVTVLPADPAHPDGTFVEDTAIVVAEGALLARPGAASRRGEVAAVAAALRAFHPAPDYPLPLASLVGIDRQKAQFLTNLERFAGQRFRGGTSCGHAAKLIPNYRIIYIMENII